MYILRPCKILNNYLCRVMNNIMNGIVWIRNFYSLLNRLHRLFRESRFLFIIYLYTFNIKSINYINNQLLAKLKFV